MLNKDLTSAKNSGIINDKLQFWWHDCKSSGPTETEVGYDCNDCGLAEWNFQDIDQAESEAGNLENMIGEKYANEGILKKAEENC